MAFIEVTDHDNKRPRLVNLEHVIMAYSHEQTDITHLLMIPGLKHEHNLKVAEDYAKIKDKIAMATKMPV